MQQKKLIQIYKNIFPIFFLGLFSFFINFHYGFIGIMPSDNTVLYNGGYRILNGYVPFTDYWLVTGPLLDYLNAFFFYLLDVSWKSYIIHSSFFNLLLAIATYYLFLKIGQSKIYSFFYSILISVLFYPTVGTPFVDHHSTFFLLIAFYSFIYGTISKNYFFFSIIPFLFCLSFLSKQTPAAYGVISIGILILSFMFLRKKEFKAIFVSLFFGSIFAFSFLIIFFISTGINLSNFFEQYILFSRTIGQYRFSTYDFGFFDIINKYKFINFYIITLLIIFLVCIRKKKNIEKIFIILSSLVLSLVLVFHQYYTLNQNYIFFLIPFLCCICHLYVKDLKYNRVVLIIMICLCVFSSIKYHLRFNEQRKFNELEKVDLNKAVDAEILSPKLKGLKWITYIYPNDPKKEIRNLQEVLEILKKDKSKKTIITEYQFIPSFLKIYDFSPNQWHHPSVSFPIRGQNFFNNYKIFFINSLKKNEIDFIFETSETDKSITELIFDKECYKKKRVGKMLVKFELLKNCKDFK